MKLLTMGPGVLALLGAGCKSPPPVEPAPPVPIVAKTDVPKTGPTVGEKADDLPPPARVVAAKDLAGDDVHCGPWRAKDLAAIDQPMLDDRVRVRFFSGGSAVGGAESAKIEVHAGADTLFIGARETFQRGDELFERRAAKAATFRGEYDAVTLPDRDGKPAIVTGVRKEIGTPKDDVIALAHGWFLDAHRNVLDVAVFASVSALKDFPACRVFAQKLVSTAVVGGRTLTVPPTGQESVKVSYTTFTFDLPPEWVMTKAMGIHDFARVHFRKRGVFPREYTDLELALDSHPGDWKSEGEPEGDRKGDLLGLPVAWHLTTTGASWGAWTVSDGVVKRDHAVASITASSAAGRDEALRFAESVKHRE